MSGIVISLLVAILPMMPFSRTSETTLSHWATTLTDHPSLPSCNQPAPTLQQPVDGSQVESLTPEFVYELVPGVTDYRFELATDSTFQSLVLAKRLRPYGSSTVGAESLDENLAPERIYYWRMASYCASLVGPYSPTFTFSTTTGVFPPVPTVTSPQDGALVASTRVVFSIDTAEGYFLRFYDSPSAPWNAPDWWGVSWLIPHPLLAQEFAPGQTVYWRIAGRNSYAIGEPQSMRSLTTPPSPVVGQVDPSSGGTLVASAGSVSLSVPPGSVSEPVTLTYRLRSRPSHALFGDSRFAGRSFSLEAANGAGDPITTFLQPMTLTIAYDPVDLLFAEIDNEAGLNVVFWRDGRWNTILPCDGCELDPTTHTVTVRLNHLTEFALVLPRWQTRLPMLLRSTESLEQQVAE